MNITNPSGKKRKLTRDKLIRFLDKQGFYLALVICAIVIGVTLLWPSPAQDNKTPKALQQTEEDASNDAKDIFEKADDEEKAQDEVVAGEADRVALLLAGLVPPVDGKIGMPYSMDSLAYNKTLKQWTTHRGVDISASAGTDVKAALGGKVESISADTLMGNCLILLHENEVRTMYAGLQALGKFKVGDKVTAGQIIGKVGSTAISEIDEGPHLHFEIHVEKESVNPAAYLPPPVSTQ